MVATAGDEWLEEESGTFGSAGDRRTLRACYAVYEANNVFYDQVLDLDALCGHCGYHPLSFQCMVAWLLVPPFRELDGAVDIFRFIYFQFLLVSLFVLTLCSLRPSFGVCSVRPRSAVGV